MRRSTFREYSFVWLDGDDKQPHIHHLAANLQTLFFRREPYSRDPDDPSRPFAMYLLVEHSAEIQEAQLRALDVDLASVLRPRFTSEPAGITWSRKQVSGNWVTEVEVPITLPARLEETKAVMRLVVLVYKALRFREDFGASLVISNETFIKPGRSRWIPEGTYLMGTYWNRYCREEGIDLG